MLSRGPHASLLPSRAGPRTQGMGAQASASSGKCGGQRSGRVHRPLQLAQMPAARRELSLAAGRQASRGAIQGRRLSPSHASYHKERTNATQVEEQCQPIRYVRFIFPRYRAAATSRKLAEATENLTARIWRWQVLCIPHRAGRGQSFRRAEGCPAVPAEWAKCRPALRRRAVSAEPAPQSG